MQKKRPRSRPRSERRRPPSESLRRWPSPARRQRSPTPNHRPERRRSQSSFQAATLRSRKVTETHLCRPTSRPCRAGKAKSGVGSMRSLSAPSPACARRSNGTRPSMASRTGFWFLSFHVFAKYIQVTFFRGASLRPPPSDKRPSTRTCATSTSTEDQLDEAQFTAWVKQASELPGEKM